ncbi:MAG: YgfZ/GcvT domain-containing protein [Frankia sp.]
MSEYRSPLLDWPGAVPADPPDAGVADHYGDPLREQRAAVTGAALVDRSHRGVVRVGGPDRRSWLHSITSQHLEALPPGRGTQLLVLSPQGRVEHHALVAEDGEATWLDLEPGDAPGLLGYLDSMRFMLRVEPADVTADRAVLSVVGPATRDVVASALELEAGGDPATIPAPAAARAADPAGATDGLYAVVQARSVAGAGHPPVLVRWMPYGADLLVPRADLEAIFAALRAGGATPAGSSAFEALRVADRRPRHGRETDNRTIPHEVNWLPTAVHLDKGCYRGQETVARVHNLGRPPRRMVLLHTDGATAPHGAPVIDTATGRPVGFVGTSAVHHELGPIALAVIKRAIADDATLVVGEPDEPIAASIDPDEEPAAPTRPAGRLRH